MNRTLQLTCFAALCSCAAPTRPAARADKIVAAVDPQKSDRDHDKVVDARDQCPDEAEDHDGFQDADGCPDPDNDADTVPDAQDRCPNEPGDVHNAGCPLQDRDHDGITDAVDACPEIPEDFDGVADTDGCPETENPDTDGDGIVNSRDACPTAAEDKDGFQDDDGCPDPDNDLDTVADADDLCPLQPGTPALHGCPSLDRDHDGINDDVDSCPDVAGLAPHGCPKRVLVTMSADHIDIEQQINFMAGKATINRSDLSMEIISQVASAMFSNPSIKVIIEGHTDDNGAADTNLVLSDDRAQAVRQALIELGTDASRLEAVGYGESKPIDTNRTPQGRAQNRRVVFTIVKNGAVSPAVNPTMPAPPPPPSLPAPPAAP